MEAALSAVKPRVKPIALRHRPLPAKVGREVASKFMFGAGVVALTLEYDAAPSQIENAIRRWTKPWSSQSAR